MTNKTELEDTQVAQRLAEIRALLERRDVVSGVYTSKLRKAIAYLLSLVDEPPAEAPLTDAEVDAYLEAHKNDPVDEDQARRVERLFRDKLATDALNAGREWLQSYQEDVVKGGRRVKHDTELLYSGTKTLIENLVRVIDTLALVDTARPTEQQPCRECGEMDHHRLTCSLNYVSPGVEFRTHVLDSERRRPTAQDAQVAQSIDIGDCPCVSYHYDVVTHGNATIPVKKQCRVHKEIAAALSTARQQGAGGHGDMTCEEAETWWREHEESMLKSMKAQGDWIVKLQQRVAELEQGVEAERQRNPDDAPCVGQGHNAGFCHQCRRYYD